MTISIRRTFKGSTPREQSSGSRYLTHRYNNFVYSLVFHSNLVGTRLLFLYPSRFADELSYLISRNSVSSYGVKILTEIFSILLLKREEAFSSLSLRFYIHREYRVFHFRPCFFTYFLCQGGKNKISTRGFFFSFFFSFHFSFDFSS